jgi:FkbM family methyltransferase
MYKIRNLFRLHFENRLGVIIYYLMRIFKLKISTSLNGLNDYYHTLIRLDAMQVLESKSTYSSKFKQSDIKITTRKRPSSDLDVLGHIFYHKAYQYVTDVYNKEFNKKHLNIIDGGANIGLASLYFKTVFDEVDLISIEPEPNNFKLLNHNLKENNIKAKVLKAGLWSKTTYLKIVSDFRDQNDWSYRVEETNIDIDDSVYAITINKIIEDNNWDSIDILKIDIEGAEKEIFLSDQSDVSFLNKTKCIAIEIHDEFNCRESIYRILEKYHFKYFNSGELTVGVNQSLRSN